MNDMSWIRRLLQSFNKPAEMNGHPHSDPPLQTIPIVKFDPSVVSESVKADLRSNLKLIDDLDRKHFEQVYEAAIRSISADRNLQVLYIALMDIDGMSKQRATQIARSLSNKATSLISREKEISLGIKYAIWMYSNAPCVENPRSPTNKDTQQDAAHFSANGKRYKISKGLLVDGKWTWPGIEAGCKCTSRVVLP